MKAILHALSYGGIEVDASRRLADLKKLDLVRIFCRKLDAEIYNEEYKVPIRLYFASEEDMRGAGERNAGSAAAARRSLPALLFFHGGGWVTESVENYDRVCARMAQATGRLVISVEYRLAPEHHFPVGLKDCYAAARELYAGRFLPEVDPARITVMGDSAGGNLAAAVCMMARDTGDFQVRKQILIYPAVNNCYTEKSAYPSVRENGEDYLLTAKKMEDYLSLYQSSQEDRTNPYFAPILAQNLRDMPRTLILTAEYDPLRDEGEAYGKRLLDAGNEVEMHRIPDALHGFFALGIQFLHVQESFEYINGFLGEAG
ncbi:MAG: alpha/beta hydrolase [Lachnospiraceae bacterium]|nr:alpha/beta hydrolase [Lachnospiraceae bacterium]